MLSSQGRRWLRVIVLATAVTFAANAPAAMAAPSPQPNPSSQKEPAPAGDVWSQLGPVPAGFGSWKALFTEQERLNAIAQQIEDSPDAKDRIAGVWVAPETHKVQIHWKGKLPDRTSKLIDQLRRKAPVDVKPAKFSRTELDQARDSLINAPGVVTATTRVDGSGIDVEVGHITPPGRQSAAGPAAQPGLAAAPAATPAPTQLTARTKSGQKVPVTVAKTDATGPRDAGCTGRLHDCNPRWGGAWITYENGLICSTGFPATAADGTTYMLTADHCAGEGREGGILGRNFKDGESAMGENIFGEYVGHQPSLDIGWIKPAPGVQLAPYVYVGSRNSATAVPIDGVALVSPGNTVLRSGAASGTIAAKVTATNQRWCREYTQVDSYNNGLDLDGDGAPDCRRYIENQIIAEREDGTAAASTGDSGGPVFQLAGTGRALVAGILSSLDGDVACPPGTPVGLMTVCGPKIGFTAASKALSSAKLRILAQRGGICPSSVSSHWIGGQGSSWVEAKNNVLTTTSAAVYYEAKGDVCTYSGTFYDYRNYSLYSTYSGTWSAFAGTF